jgi:hypothetical protein
VWTKQGPATPVCNNNSYRAADSFQQGIEAEGIYGAWQELRKIMGPGWHINNAGTASGGSPTLDGATSPSNVLVSEKISWMPSAYRTAKVWCIPPRDLLLSMQLTPVC